MRSRMRRSFRKCWPRLLRTGGCFTPSEQQMTTRSTPDEDQREIVAPARAFGVRIHDGHDLIENLGRLLETVCAHRLEHAVLAEPVADAISRVAHAVGEQDEQIASGVPL